MANSVESTEPSPETILAGFQTVAILELKKWGISAGPRKK